MSEANLQANCKPSGERNAAIGHSGTSLMMSVPGTMFLYFLYEQPIPETLGILICVSIGIAGAKVFYFGYEVARLLDSELGKIK